MVDAARDNTGERFFDEGAVTADARAAQRGIAVGPSSRRVGSVASRQIADSSFDESQTYRAR